MIIDIAEVSLEVFQSAFDFAGGGRYGTKDHPWTKEQGDYNAKYLVAVALLDNGVEPFADEQLRGEIVDAVDRLDTIATSELVTLLAAVDSSSRRTRSRARF